MQSARTFWTERQHLLQHVRRHPAPWLCLSLVILTLLFLRPILLPPSGWATGGADVRALFVPWLTTARQALLEGRLPLWDPYQSTGYPFLTNPQVALFYPATWLALVLPIRVALSWHIALHLFLLGSGVLLAARALHASWFAAYLAALSVCFSGFAAARISAGHIGVLATFSWLPWLLLTTGWAAKARTISAALIAGLPLGLAILAGHTTSMIYVGLFWLAFTCYLAVREKSILPLRNLFLSVVVGIALSGIQLIPLLQFTQFSSRLAEGDFQSASEFSLPVGHLLTLLLPEYFGEPSQIGYWSVPVFEEYAYYAGILPLLVLVLAVRRPTKRTWFFIMLGVGGLWLALGRNSVLYRQLFALLPPFRLARAPARAAVLFTFSIALLLADTVTHWRRHADDATLNATMRAALAVGLVSSLAAIGATGAVFAAIHPTDTSGRLWHQLGGWSWLILMLLLGGILLWRYLATETAQGRRHVFALALIVLVVGDLWHYSHKMIRLEPTAPAPLWAEAAAVIGEAEERVIPWGVSIFEQNGAGLVGLKSVFGYNALALAANDALTGSVPDPRSTAYDLLSAGYVISGLPLVSFTGGEQGLTLVHSSSNAWIYSRPRSMPLVRLVPNVEVIADDARAIERIHEPSFDPASTVILRSMPTCLSATSESATSEQVRLLEHSDTYWRIETQSAQPSVLVVSESAYPGWRVFIDGEAAVPFTAYTSLRAVCVPAGNHVVEWKYDPAIYLLGMAVTGSALVICFLAIWQMRKPAPVDSGRMP